MATCIEAVVCTLGVWLVSRYWAWGRSRIILPRLRQVAVEYTSLEVAEHNAQSEWSILRRNPISLGRQRSSARLQYAHTANLLEDKNIILVPQRERKPDQLYQHVGQCRYRRTWRPDALFLLS